MLATVTSTGRGLRVESGAIARGAGAPLVVDLGRGRSVLFDRFDLRRPVAIDLDPDRADDADARWLVGTGLGSLVDAAAAGAPVDIAGLPEEAVGLLSRLAVLEALRDAGGLPSRSEGLIAAEQLVVLTELSDRGMAFGGQARGLALAAAGPLLRGFDRGAVPARELWIRAARAAAGALPEADPTRQLLEQRLSQEGSAPRPWRSSRPAPPPPTVLPMFRGATPDDGRRGWVLWADVGLDGDADAAPVTREHEGGAVIDVALPLANTSSPQVPSLWARIVDPAGDRVVAWAPLFLDGSALVGHLYLDQPMAWEQHRLEVTSSPHTEVLTEERHRTRVCEQLALGVMRANVRGATAEAARLGELLQTLDRAVDLSGLTVWGAPGAEDGAPLLADAYGAASQPTAE